eukprot:SAG11_NODE_59_length_19156_cov_11.188750_5_plen_97_part_00
MLAAIAVAAPRKVATVHSWRGASSKNAPRDHVGRAALPGQYIIAAYTIGPPHLVQRQRHEDGEEVVPRPAHEMPEPAVRLGLEERLERRALPAGGS